MNNVQMPRELLMTMVGQMTRIEHFKETYSRLGIVPACNSIKITDFEKPLRI